MLLLQDELINLDDLTELEDSTVFRLEQLPTKSYEKEYDVQLDITIEMNLNQLVIARDGYTVLDYLSDIGGMQSILITGSAILLTIWNYQHLDNFLVSQLYRLSTNAQKADDFRSKNKRKQYLRALPCQNCIDFFCDKLPLCLQCGCRSSPQARGFKEGHRLL